MTSTYFTIVTKVRQTHEIGEIPRMLTVRFHFLVSYEHEIVRCREFLPGANSRIFARRRVEPYRFWQCCWLRLRSMKAAITGQTTFELDMVYYISGSVYYEPDTSRPDYGFFGSI